MVAVEWCNQFRQFPGPAHIAASCEKVKRLEIAFAEIGVLKLEDFIKC